MWTGRIYCESFYNPIFAIGGSCDKADITPPVCMAVFATAGIAGSRPMLTSVVTVKLAIAAFIVPFMFIYNPILLLQDVTVLKLVIAIPTAFIGITAISASVIGFFITKTKWFERVLLFISGLLLINESLFLSFIGISGVIVIGVIQHFRKNSDTVVNIQKII